MDFGQNVAAVLVLVDWLTVCGCTNRSYTPIKAVMCIPEIGTTEAVLVILYTMQLPRFQVCRSWYQKLQCT